MIGKSIFLKRLEKLRKEIKENSLDAILISKRENYIYFSGFTGSNGCLLITVNEAVLFTDFRYVTQTKEEVKDFKIEIIDKSFKSHINDYLKNFKIKSLGFESTNMTYAQYGDYKKEFEHVELIPVKNILENIRAIKDEYEIEIIKEAVRIADISFEHILKYLKPGVSEVEVAAELEYFMKKNGAKGTSFDTIVASGFRGALPHGVASNKKIQSGEAIVLDFGVIYDNYCSDMTRTVFVGKPNEKMEEIFKIVLEAQLKAEEVIKEGIICSFVDKTARDIITNKGYGKEFGHSLGHGVGLEVHEEPKVSSKTETKLISGMIITVEPGIYVENLGGVRIEDMVLVTENGYEILTKSDKKMIKL